MLCDMSDFRLSIAEKLGFAVCNTAKEDFIQKATEYFGTAPSLTGSVPDIDCWIDAAGAESILASYMQNGKVISRFVAVAVNNKPRQIDLLHMTYAQKSMSQFFGEQCRERGLTHSVMDTFYNEEGTQERKSFAECQIPDRYLMKPQRP